MNCLSALVLVPEIRKHATLSGHYTLDQIGDAWIGKCSSGFIISMVIRDLVVIIVQVARLLFQSQIRFQCAICAQFYKYYKKAGLSTKYMEFALKEYMKSKIVIKGKSILCFGTDIQEKDKKKAKNDQTKHGMEKTKSNQSQSQSKSESQPRQSQKSTK
ncbi:hypothetical protein Tco_1374553 [Tanacetum coccineum]